MNSGIITSFTEKELNALGVKIPDVHLTTSQIKEIRKNLKVSQTVFAQLLNVSPSSIRQWEQGKRQPTGATRVLLGNLGTRYRFLPKFWGWYIITSSLKRASSPFSQHRLHCYVLFIA